MSDATQRRALTIWGDQALPQTDRVKLAANAVVKKGYHLSISSSGYAAPFTAATGLKSGGIALEDADNTGGADGDLSVDVETMPTDMVNGTAGDALADSDAPCACYALDNQTVGKTSNGGTRSIAGLFLGINPETGAPRVLVGRAGWLLGSSAAASAAGGNHTGTATLVAGTVTVADVNVTASSKILLSRKSKLASTALGELSTPTRTAGTSFVIIAQKPADGTTETGDISSVDYSIEG
jgi:hypothetical protein